MRFALLLLWLWCLSVTVENDVYAEFDTRRLFFFFFFYQQAAEEGNPSLGRVHTSRIYDITTSLEENHDPVCNSMQHKCDVET